MARILVVDDDAELREMLTEQLGRAGHVTVTAGNGKVATKLLEAPDSRIELVLTDLYMPERDGIEVILQCRRLGIKVVAMTGGDAHGSSSILGPATMLGATQVLRKPFSTDELLYAVDAALAAT